MKTTQLLVATIILCLFSFISKAQISGPQTIPGTYPSIEAAVNALNLQGVGNGGATFNVAAGYTETPTAPIILTLGVVNGSSAANPLVFQKSGVGANPLVTASTAGSSITVDGIFILNGTDYVTINGIDLQENVLNTTPTAQMEWGYALVKSPLGGGASYNTIKNCVVTLNKANVNSVGIYLGNHITTNTTTFIVTSANGTSSYNKFYNNTTQNTYSGIYLAGYAAAAPYDFYDQGNEIGRDGISTNRNQILNFGGLANTSYGVYGIYQNGLKVFSTYVNNSGGAPAIATLYGIFTSTGNNANIDIYGDTLIMSSSATASSSLYAIQNSMGSNGAGNTVNIYNNVVDGCSYPTNLGGAFYGVSSTASATYTNMYNNKVNNNSIPGTGTFYGLNYTGSSATLCLAVNIYGNTVSNNTKTGIGGSFFIISANASTLATNCYNNQLFNNSNSASTGTMYGYYNNVTGYNENVYNNTIYNNTGGTGQTIMLYVNSGSGPTNKQVYDNTIYNISGNTAASVAGIHIGYGTIVNIYRNNIYNITNNSATGGTPAVYGIQADATGNTQTTVYNNFISELKAPSASNSNAVYGIWLNGSTASVMNAYYNSIYLNGTSTGINFGTAALVCSASPLSIDLRNNILVNASTPAGTGTTRALVRASALNTNYALTSGFNCLFAGTPGPSNLIFSDGTNNDQTLQAFKNRVGPREQSSFSSLPPFINIATSPYNLHLQNSIATQCEGGAKPIAGFTLDYDGGTRNLTTPDVGADELTGVTVDIAAPDIQYALLGTSSVAANRVLTNFATITDPSGINISSNTKPRIYYKRPINANTYTNNSNATDGWKYVESTSSSSPFSFTIDYSLLFGGGVINGDFIQYFVVAQDLNGVPTVGLNNGGFTVQPSTVNLSAANFPLNNTINQYPIVSAALSGTINVGPTELITSLTNLGGIFQLINASTLAGNLIINVTGDLPAETGTYPLNQWSEEGVGNYTVSIVSSAAVVRNIYGSNLAASLIRFDGADRVNIDGRFANAGTYLMFRNTSNTAPTIGFLNDAQSNTVQYSIIESGNTSMLTTLGGAIWIGTTTGLLGNDNNTINNCDIRDRSDIPGNPAIGINCQGTSNIITQYNDNTVISNNSIHDWYLLNGATQYAVNIGTGNSASTVSGNSFYQTATRSHTLSGGFTRAINIGFTSNVNSNGGNTVTGNFIGGSAPGATGNDMTINVTGVGNSTQFGAISVITGLIPNNIQNNIIRKIDFTTNAPTGNTTMWFGLQLGQGVFDVGNTTGNVIGDATITSSIKITINAGGAGVPFLAGILASTISGSYNIQNNTISGISVAGTGTSTVYFQWIQVQGTPSATSIVTGNTIGSTTTANSIQNNISTAASVTFAIRSTVTSGAALTISNNTIQNITDFNTNPNGVFYGVLATNTVGASGTVNITGNTLRDLAMAGGFTGTAFGNLAMSLQNFGGTTHNISGNIIAGIICSNTTVAQNYAVGLQIQGSSCGGTISQNRIFDIRNLNTGASPGIAGIYINSGLDWTLKNNMVSLSNGANTNLVDVNGINDFLAQNTNIKLYYNSVYLGGSTSSGNLTSASYVHAGAATVIIKDNILYNKRSGGTGSHLAIANASTTPTVGWAPSSSNFNAFVVSDTTTVGYWNGLNYNMSGWRTISGGDLTSIWETSSTVTSGSLFVNVNLGNLHINTSIYPEALATPIAGITVDYDNNIRSATYPTIGADELACSVIAFTATSQTNISCNGGNNGSATVTGIGGNGITYNWTPSGGTAATATGLSAGTYTCTISNICGNTGTVTVTITQPAVLANTTMQNDVSCNGANDGNAMVMVTGGVGPYTYLWAPSGGTSATASGLAPGTYTCTTTDANSCTLSQTFNITEPPAITISTMQTNILCNGGNNGTAMVMVSGGSAPYIYSWTPSGGNAATATGLTAGTYTCVIIDSHTCLSSQTFVITEPTLLVAAATATLISCNGGSATVTVTATGGTMPYTGDSTFTVTTGTYTYTVLDTNGCSSTTSITVTEPAVLVATATATTIACFGDSATVTVTATGGTMPYSGDSTFIVTVGTYSYTVVDTNGCSSTTSITVTEPTAIVTAVTQTNVSCFAGNNGTIDLTVSGGTSPYTFDWNSGTYTTEDLSGLLAGNYVGIVTDSNGCTSTITVTITEPDVLVATVTLATNPSTCSGSDGSIDISIFGGTPGYTFLWSNAATTEDISALSAGSYSCVVTDNNGCIANVNDTLTSFTIPTVTLAITEDTVCVNDASFALTGGVPTGGIYTGTAVTAGVFDPATASAGMNTITYTYVDVNGCTGFNTDSIYVDACVGINTLFTQENNFTLFPNPNNGTFTLQLNMTAVAQVIVYDAIGQIVSSQYLQPSTQHQLQLETSGVYLIAVIAENGQRSTKRVIVNR